MCLNIGIVTCGPNEALIISGLFQGAEGTLVVGGRAIVLPGIDPDSLLEVDLLTCILSRLSDTSEDPSEHDVPGGQD